jgi:hypothetical protein
MTRKILARDWIFQVSDGATPTPAYLEIGGINSFEMDPNANNAAMETTTFDSNGEYEGTQVQRGGQLSLEGMVDRGTDGATPNVGQVRVDELGRLVAYAALGTFRFRHVDDTAWTVWEASVQPGAKGGGNNDATSWSATIIRSGAATTAAVV